MKEMIGFPASEYYNADFYSAITVVMPVYFTPILKKKDVTMGMYDEVIFDDYRMLPVSVEESQRIMAESPMQTKDFDCIATTFKVGTDKSLYVELFHIETVPKKARPIPNQPYIGMYSRVRDGWEDTHFHGVFHCYTLKDEFRLKFTDGKLVEIGKVK
jgi:hypothetical protein